VAELLQSCLETVRLKASQKQLRLAAEVPPACAAISGDPNALREILINLLDNATQYTPAGGAITARAAESEAGITLSVSDTGIGIPQSEQQRIFERFYRVDDARSREAGGTGLGLAIAKHLVEMHGGTIQVQSEVNRGSTFLVFLPFE